MSFWWKFSHKTCVIHAKILFRGSVTYDRIPFQCHLDERSNCDSDEKDKDREREGTRNQGKFIIWQPLFTKYTAHHHKVVCCRWDFSQSHESSKDHLVSSLLASAITLLHLVRPSGVSGQFKCFCMPFGQFAGTFFPPLLLLLLLSFSPLNFPVITKFFRFYLLMTCPRSLSFFFLIIWTGFRCSEARLETPNNLLVQKQTLAGFSLPLRPVLSSAHKWN